MNLPLIVSVRGHDLYREPRRDLGAVFALARRLPARTPETAADLVLAGAPAEKVVVLPTGVDLAKLLRSAIRSCYARSCGCSCARSNAASVRSCVATECAALAAARSRGCSALAGI